MRPFTLTRPILADAPSGLLLDEWNAHIRDAGLRCHLSWGIDFDSRAISLKPIPDHWNEEVKERGGLENLHTEIIGYSA
jgi:hypothetical protein